jgi:hypothetical protein
VATVSSMRPHERLYIPLRRTAGRAVLRAGLTPGQWLTIKTMRRTDLIYRSRGSVPGATPVWRAPLPVTEDDVALCKRLLAAFAAAHARHDFQAASGIWASIIDRHQQQLMATLDGGDAHALARLLAALFRKEFMWGFGGMAPWSVAAQGWSRIGSRVFTLKLLDSLISLGEALGVVAVENPEQGYMRHVDLKQEGAIAEMVKALEQVTGCSIAFPDIGAPYGLSVDGRLINQETSDHIYTAVRLREALCLHTRDRAQNRLRIVEIGAGYGGVCYWFLRMCAGIARYTIVDLPIINVLQGYFLAKALGPSRVSLLGEPRAQIVILPDFALADVETPYDALVNKDSMPEMPYDAMVAYLEWAHLNCDGLFYSYNHEAKAPFEGHPQGRVADATAQVGGFHRLRREQSWLRRGHVEEFYARRDASLSRACRAENAGDALR